MNDEDHVCIKMIRFCNIITADLYEKSNPKKSLSNLKCFKKPVSMRVCSTFKSLLITI